MSVDLVLRRPTSGVKPTNITEWLALITNIIGIDKGGNWWEENPNFIKSESQPTSNLHDNLIWFNPTTNEIKICFNEVFYDLTSKKSIWLFSTFTAIENDTSKCDINQPYYNKYTDVLLPFHSIIGFLNTDNYTISSDSKSIELVGFTMNPPEKIDFIVIKDIPATAPYSVSEAILDQPLQDKINGAYTYTDEKVATAFDYTDEKIADLIDSAPEALNTLNELAAALGSDPNFATTVINQIASKASQEIVTELITTVNNHKNDLEAHGLKTGVVNLHSLDFGNNFIQSTAKVPVYPEISFKGRHYINLLGKDGDCEDTNVFGTVNGSLTLDSTTKVFGDYSIKATATSNVPSWGGMLTMYDSILDKSKYYLFSGYLKNGNASDIAIGKSQGDGGTDISAGVIDTTKFVRTGIKLQPSDFGPVGTQLFVLVNDSDVTGKYGWFDGLMLNEITEDEYNNLTVDQLLAKYPYVESYGVLTNPYFENRRHNLVRNGNGEEGIGWWVPSYVNGLTGGVYTSFVCDGDRFTLIANKWYGVEQRVKVKPNTDYYIAFENISGAYVYVKKSDGLTNLAAGTSGRTFNSGLDSEIFIKIVNVNDSGTPIIFSKVMLVEGTTAPTEYKSCDIQRFVIEGQFTDDDEVQIKDGKVSGLLWWKHKALFGKDYNWAFSQDKTGFKEVKISNFTPDAVENRLHTAVKYDGKILGRIANQGILDAADKSYMNWSGDKNLYISVSDTDTGWAETITPNADEIKAFMNGWKATANNGTRYTAWVSVVDGTTTPTTQSIDYVKANIAPNYEGYQIHYKLANPEPITNDIVKGNIWAIVPGDNYINIDSGIVLGEVAKPQLSTNLLRYYINDSWLAGNDKTASNCQNKVEDIFAIYKNNIFDPVWEIYDDGVYNYGNKMASTALANYDLNALYTIDYQILKTLHAQSISNLSLAYSQDVFSAIGSIATTVTNQIASKASQAIVTELTTTVNNHKNDLEAHKADYRQHPYYAGNTGSTGTGILQITLPVTYPNWSAVPIGACFSFKNIYNNQTVASGIKLALAGLAGEKPILKSNGSLFTTLTKDVIYTVRWNGENFILQGEGGEYGNVTPDDVIKGVTFGTEEGLKTGTLELTGNAAATDVLSGKTFYSTNPKSKLTGSMTNRGAVTHTITTQGGSYIIPAGYHNGSGKVTASFANLIASNIRAGVNIGGVVGNLVPKVPYPTSTAIDVYFNQLGATHTILTLPSDWSYFTFVSDMSGDDPESRLYGYNWGNSKLVFGNATLLSETGSYLNSSTTKIYSFTMYRVNSNSARVIGITYHDSSSNRIAYEGPMTITLANHSLTAQLGQSSSEGSANLKLKGVYYVG